MKIEFISKQVVIEFILREMIDTSENKDEYKKGYFQALQDILEEIECL